MSTLHQPPLPPPPPVPLGIPPPSVHNPHNPHNPHTHPPPHPPSAVPPHLLNLYPQLQPQQPKHDPTTLILTHVPMFLRYPRNLRDFIYACCGSVKSVAYSCEIKRAYSTTASSMVASATTSATASGGGAGAGGNNEANTTGTNGGNGTTVGGGLVIGKKKTPEEEKAVVAVVRMTHSSGAFNLVRNWEPASRRLRAAASSSSSSSSSSETNTKKTKSEPIEMKAFMLYATNEHSPPFDPVSNPSDRTTIDSIWDGLHNPHPSSIAADESVVTKLVEAYRTVETRQLESDALAGTTNGGVGVGVGVGVGTNGATTTGGTDVLNPDGTTMNPTDPNNATASSSSSHNNNNNDATTTTTTIKSKLDVSKVAAAAGGGAYDEEADPLNAPDVLAAVARFKTKLEEASGRIRKRRVEYVRKRLEEEGKKARERLLERRETEKKEREAAVVAAAAAATTAATAATVDNVGGGTTQPVDSGRRGVSNLPSWMTQKRSAAEISGTTDNSQPPPLPPQPPSSSTGDNPPLPPLPPPGDNNTQQQPPLPPPRYLSEANRDPNARKVPRLDTGMSIASIREANRAADAAAEQRKEMKQWTKEQILADGAVFPPSKKGCCVVVDGTEEKDDEEDGMIRTFVKEQIVEYLGEEETTLVDFVMNHLQKRKMGKECTTKALLEELGIVLEEDAETFVVDLFRKILED